MPTPHRLANLGLAILIAVTLSTAWLLDGPSAVQTDADITADIAAAQAQARAAASCGGDITHCLPAHVREARRLQAHQVAAK